MLPRVKAATRCRTPNGYLRSVAGLDTTGRKLDFSVTFYFDRSVSADDHEPLPNGNGLSMLKGAVAFATTHWSMVVTAQGESPAADKALEKLCRTYWWPVYSFIRRQGAGPEDAEDLTQSFFAVLFERRDLQAVRRENGRLRSFFFASLKNFLAKERRYATAAKRGEGRPLIPLEELLARKRADLEPADTLTPDRIFERRWALTVLEQALARLEDEYRMAGNPGLFGQLKKLLTDECQRPFQAEIAHQFEMTENAVNQAFHRLRQRYREFVHEEIAHTVIAPDDTEDELRHLIAVLRG
jgi:RNA polymerase sigma-70 factor (ECF subfamily)